MVRYTVQTEISHDGLNKYMVIKAPNEYELYQKVEAQLAQWDEQWERKLLAEKKRLERESIQRTHEENKREALILTEAAEGIYEKLGNLIKDNLDGKATKWEELKKSKKFPYMKPLKPEMGNIPEAPNKNDEKYSPKFKVLDYVIRARKKALINKYSNEYVMDYESYTLEKEKIEGENKQKQLDYKNNMMIWEEEKTTYEGEIEKFNNYVDEMKSKYEADDSEAIGFFVDNLLTRLEFPIEFVREVESEYLSDTKILVIDFSFPTMEDLPKLKKVTYIKSREELSETYFSEAQITKKYDDIVYKIVLLVLNEIFKNSNGKIDSVVLNGKVHTTDLTTGKEIEPFILSVKVDNEDFKELKLGTLDPKAWFKSAKGIAAAKISTVVPVTPILKLNKDDSRFIDSKNILYNIDEELNLAEMDWQDFENLIREIFEQEFNINGGEVKITQASRDGGVDAIAFDPDPIRGGKIVIQAKRYNNVVGVAAVRDLYGTVMNEGANKGILVSTSNYGSDAYNFVKDKPLTLLNGANLLYLLEKHGHKATIKLKQKY